MKIKVGVYSEEWDCHRCELTHDDGSVEKGVFVDVIVAGDIEELDDKSVVGRTLSCESTSPFVRIAHNVRIAD